MKSSSGSPSTFANSSFHPAARFLREDTASARPILRTPSGGFPAEGPAATLGFLDFAAHMSSDWEAPYLLLSAQTKMPLISSIISATFIFADSTACSGSRTCTPHLDAAG